VLFRLDDEPFRLALARAEAQLNVVRNDIETQKASYRQKQEELKLSQTDIDFYQRDFSRQQALVARNNASEARFDEARHNLDAARQRYAAARQELAALAAGLNGDPSIAVEQHPRYRDALAHRDQARRDLDHTIVRAPYAGIVTNVPRLQPGMYLQASTPGFSLVATDHVWIEANPKETDLTNVKPGQTVSVTIDTYPDVEFRGTVASLSPASGAEFSLLPAQNTTGNWVKVVQRIPLRVRLDLKPDQPPLRAGMSAIVEIDTGHTRVLPRAISSAIASVKG
jgi:membrane fusion protein, multidrug efflux system